MVQYHDNINCGRMSVNNLLLGAKKYMEFEKFYVYGVEVDYLSCKKYEYIPWTQEEIDEYEKKNDRKLYYHPNHSIEKFVKFEDVPKAILQFYKEHKIKIEALAMADGDFVLTITRFGKKDCDDNYQISKNKKLKVKRKQTNLSSENLVYAFNSFDDFCLFASYVNTIKNYNTIAKNTVLYTYNDTYYLVFSKLNLNHPYIKKFYTFITEFATYVNSSELFYYKLLERGKIVLKNNAIKLCLKHFY